MDRNFCIKCGKDMPTTLKCVDEESSHKSVEKLFDEVMDLNSTPE
jgi:hypothetical protein